MKKVDLNYRDGYVVSVTVALLIASVLLGWYYTGLRSDLNGYMSISLLDSQKKADNYPKYLINGVNNTFSVYVEVKNFMRTTMDTEVRVRVTNDVIYRMPLDSITPTATFANTIEDGETIENIATVSLKESGNYSVVFELWIKESGNVTDFRFSENYCVLNVQVV